MKRYDKYKPSGIDWIGDIPEHWTVATVGRVTNLGRGRVISNLEIGENPGEYPVYSSQTENNGEMGHLATYDFDGEYVTWTTDGANAGTVFHRSGKFNCTNVCGTIQPKNWEQLDLRFLPYYLNLGTKYSVRLDINPKLMNNMMAKIPLVIPDLTEQRAISDYLNQRIKNIESLISSKGRFIQLLKEESNSALDSFFVNLSKNYPSKKLKYLVSKVGSGITPSGGASVYLNSGIPLLRSQNIYSDGLRLDDVAYISEDIDEQMSNSRIQEGDVLLNITGASIGRCYFVPKGFGRGNVNQHVCVIRPIPTIISTEYLQLFLASNQGQVLIDFCQNGANREGLNFQQIKSFLVPLPELKKQVEVVDVIHKELENNKRMLNKIEREIELLKEYKLSLIYETVTGKIKVI